ncbi:MAG: bifunctional methylenetetrahydrofolate dehydrogenase/methenyltetrahydrofolate cyclohydrolase FolD [Candidatus Heimdallarchaeota archaeon]|nr:bifunctional methylenetetrahydrofolate dehydrogenase/methenyltetrahydrofolate cyclohydrolase FolD [Candidatus Heimdallarchaeota archaeon]
MELAEITAHIDAKLKEGIIDGKAIGNEIRYKMKQEIEEKNLKPYLVTILVGDDPASHTYVSFKEKACNAIGIKNDVFRMPKETSEEELFSKIDELNNNQEVDGILLQLPLPDHLKEQDATMRISPDKDVDGLHYVSAGKLWVGMPTFRSCTPNGCMELLKRANVPLKGANAVVIGRSNLVGRPMVRMLETEHATVTLCHSRTRDLGEITRRADIIVAAAGRINLITEDMVSEGTVVIDVGTNRNEEGKLVGDVDYENVKNKTKLITPVPGGVGPMTITMLLANTLISYKRKVGLD